MPSVNRYVPIHGERRLRLNTCEGQVGIVEEIKVEGRWVINAAGPVCINLTRDQARALVAQLADQMEKNF